MAATVLVRDDTFELLLSPPAPGGPGDGGAAVLVGHARPLDGAALARLTGLAARYALLERRPDAAAALAIGRELHDWLDGGQGAFARLLEGAARPLVLTVHCPARTPSPAAWALLQAPWELLADARGFMTADALLQLAPVRRLGPVEPPPPADDFRLGLAFMAAAPEGVAELDYEAEEAAILDAADPDRLDLLVDESGEAETLGQRLAELGGLPVVHLSCHGRHDWRDRPTAEPRPVLMLEDGDFGPYPTDAPELLRALRPAPPRLLFLSACLSASAPGRPGGAGRALPDDPDAKQPEGGVPGTGFGAATGAATDPADDLAGADATNAHTLAHSLTAALIQAGLPAVLGWDGSVGDTAATRFAAELYGRLARREGLALAVAEARRALLDSADPSLRRHWHLARLWLGGRGDALAPLAVGRRRRSLLPPDHIHPELLGKQVPVAHHALFVGRRRELKRALGILDGRRHCGVLLTGLGRLGKSSLAARIANRRRDDLTLAVLHGPFGSGRLIDCLEETLHGCPPARERLREGAARVRAAAQRGPEAELEALGDLLADLLEGPCAQRGVRSGAQPGARLGTQPGHGSGHPRPADCPPLLLILDDFEQLLEETPGVRPVQARHAGLIATLLRAFDPTRTDSRLLVTSRFPFRLGPPDTGPDRLGDAPSATAARRDPAARLARIELASFQDTAVRKLALRQRNAARAARASGTGGTGAAAIGDLPAREALIPRAQAAARGNPGLLDLLVARLLLNPAVPLGQAEAALAQMETYLAGGALPELETVRETLEGIALDTLLRLAGPAGRALLRALTLFDLPVPPAAAQSLAAAVGGRPQDLADLGLTEPAADPVARTRPALRPSPLAAGRLAPLGPDERTALAACAARPLFDAWGGAQAERPAAADLELARLALAAEDADIACACGAEAIEALETQGYNRAAELTRGLLALLARDGRPPSPRMRAFGARVLAAAGHASEADALLAADGADVDALEPLDAGHLAFERGRRLQQQGELDAAADAFAAAARHAEAAGLPISVAVARGQIADILQRRGELDEALRIRTEEELPVYERLGDVRSAAVTRGQIADILQSRGELEEALRIRTEEELPVYERLGDVRSAAVTRGQIADILQSRGELEEALRIRTEEQLPVFERLGDVRSAAVTRGQIADILESRGELDEALRIRTEEQLPVFERLGDVRSAAVTRGQIADILHSRGELDEALRIRTEEELPVYERLGDVRSAAVTRGQIADILESRGELDEALRIRTEEQLPVFERLGDVRSAAVTRGQIADILHSRGELDEALRIRTEEELPVYERLGDVRSAAVTRGQIADILESRGELDEALRIRTEEQLPVYERLGDVRSAAVTRGQIADILESRGELDEALRIRTEEQLPVYERLGDVRSAAVTRGQIADILESRGELEEALRIRTEEELPLYERLGDVRSAAMTRGRIADILVRRGEFDAALRIRTEEELPVYERLGDVHALLVCRTGIAITLLLRMAQTGSPADGPRAKALLCQALAEARRLGLAEAGQIEAVLAQVGLECGDGA